MSNAPHHGHSVSGHRACKTGDPATCRAVGVYCDVCDPPETDAALLWVVQAAAQGLAHSAGMRAGGQSPNDAAVRKDAMELRAALLAWENARD